MTDEQRKALTLYLGECWHDVKQGAGGVFSCGNCGYTPSEIQDNYNRIFTTDADMMALFRKMASESCVIRFEEYAYKCYWRRTDEQDTVFLTWLFYDPERFCCLVAEWLEVKK